MLKSFTFDCVVQTFPWPKTTEPLIIVLCDLEKSVNKIVSEATMSRILVLISQGHCEFISECNTTNKTYLTILHKGRQRWYIVHNIIHLFCKIWKFFFPNYNTYSLPLHFTVLKHMMKFFQAKNKSWKSDYL